MYKRIGRNLKPFLENRTFCLCRNITTQSKHFNNVKQNDSLEKKDEFQWRRPWNEKEEQYFKMLKVFYSESNNVSILKFLQSPINLSPKAIYNWLQRKQEEKEILMQAFIPERNQVLGHDLAAAHFVVFRNGAVKFHGDDAWIKSNNDDYSLPDHYIKDKYLEAIDCSNMNLYYEGLSNFRNLQRVQWLSLNGCEHMDDWCLDRVSACLMDSLVYLDLRNCPNIRYRGLCTLYKMNHLKILYLDDILRTSEYEMTCLMLQDLNPKLQILVGDE